MIPRRSRGYFIFGHSPHITGYPHVGMECLPARKGLLAARKRVAWVKHTSLFKRCYPALSEDQCKDIVDSIATAMDSARAEKVSLAVAAPPSFAINARTTLNVVQSMMHDARKSIVITLFAARSGHSSGTTSISWQEEKKLERRKSSVRCKVEYVFRIVKDIFHWRKARYKSIAKNHAFANLAFASANLYMLATMQPLEG